MPGIKGKALTVFMTVCCAFCFLLLDGLVIASAEDTPSSDKNLEKCQKWCEKINPCKCSTVKGCGKDGETIRSFRGKGQNWYACRYESDIKAWNKTGCQAYCARNPKVCVSCNDAKGCGPGLVSMKTFRFGNRTHLDYYACKKK